MSIDKEIPNWLAWLMSAERWLLYPLMPLIFYMLAQIMLVVPNEQLMGPVQRIFYVHAASAIACYFSFAIVFICSIGYLIEKKRIFDVINVSAAEVGFVFCSVVLISGMIWGHSAWNTWFSWEPRLVSFLLLWLIFLSFLFLRAFGNSSQTAIHSAILGIVGTVMVPVMIFSIRFWPGIAQLHPEVVAKGGLAPEMKYAFLVAILTMIALQFILLIYRLKLEVLKIKFDEEITNGAR